MAEWENLLVTPFEVGQLKFNEWFHAQQYTHLRDLHIEASKGRCVEVSRERMETKATDTVLDSLWPHLMQQQWRVRVKPLSAAQRGTEAAFWPEWLTHIVTEPTDRGGYMVKRSGSLSVVAPIPREKMTHICKCHPIPVTHPASGDAVAVEVLSCSPLSTAWKGLEGQKHHSS